MDAFKVGKPLNVGFILSWFTTPEILYPDPQDPRPRPKTQTPDPRSVGSIFHWTLPSNNFLVRVHITYWESCTRLESLRWAWPGLGSGLVWGLHLGLGSWQDILGWNAWGSASSLILVSAWFQPFTAAKPINVGFRPLAVYNPRNLVSWSTRPQIQIPDIRSVVSIFHWTLPSNSFLLMVHITYYLQDPVLGKTFWAEMHRAERHPWF